LILPSDILSELFFLLIAIAKTLLKYKNMEQDADLKSSKSDYIRNEEALNST